MLRRVSFDVKIWFILSKELMIIKFDSFKGVEALMCTFFNKSGPEFNLSFDRDILMMIIHMFENILSGVFDFSYVHSVCDLIFLKIFSESRCLCSIDIGSDTDCECF